MTVKTFEELHVWQVCREIRREISRLVKEFPADERYRLADQMVRASRSATANLAEGFGRFHSQDNIRFCRLARGSLCEIIDHLTVVSDEGYLTDQQCSASRQKVVQALTLLNGYIRYLNNAKTSISPNNEQQATNNAPTSHP